MRLFKIIIITILFSILVLPFFKYVHSKTIGKGQTDCMIEYVNKYYPYGQTYLIDGKYPHIDKIGLTYMQPVKKINGCDFGSDIFNSTYCIYTLILEQGKK